MARNDRISIVLTERDKIRLARLAEREQMTNARTAALLVVGGLEREIQRQAYAAGDQGGVPALSSVDDVRGDIEAALITPGVAGVLAGHRHGAAPSSLVAARYLQIAAAWLQDPRPVLAKGEPPRLRDVLDIAGVGAGLGTGLDLSGAGERPDKTPDNLLGRLSASDKGTLLEVTPAAGQGSGDAL